MEHYMSFGHLVSDVQVGKSTPKGGIPLNFTIGVNSDTEQKKLSPHAKFRYCTYWVNSESYADKMVGLLKKGTPVTVLSENGVTLKSYQNMSTGETTYMIALRVTSVQVHQRTQRGQETAQSAQEQLSGSEEHRPAAEPQEVDKAAPTKPKSPNKRKKAEPKQEEDPFLTHPEDDGLPF